MTSVTFPLSSLLRDSKYSLSQFSQKHIEALEEVIFLKEVRGKEAPYVRCLVRDKDIKLTPEEAVRQLYVRVLHEDLGYPIDRMELEYSVSFGREKKRADIVIFDRQDTRSVYLIVELKKPKLKDGKEQLKSYCNATGAPIGVWTNGESISYYHRKDPNFFEDIPGIPRATEKLSDILTERWTIGDLVERDKLINERKSLKDLILEMEDEVLANAGVDVFEELFKLIFTKLFDELASGRDKSRHLEFRNYGDTETELKEKIGDLFDRAKDKWEGVFTPGAKIQLTASHLSVCVSSLQDVKLFNSNLDVVDEAFEYLINKSSKGEKGQYFTPRYVIDMCVKMLDPKEDETLIDTAAGSCGFPVHAMFHVWQRILTDEGLPKSHLFTSEKKPTRCTDYVNNKVFAIDFDERSVRVARTLNLIAGDGQTNVLHLNTLDWERWDEQYNDPTWLDIYGNGWKNLRRNLKNPRARTVQLEEEKGGKIYVREKKQYDCHDFTFDVLLANPPFAGDIKESRILAKYELGKKPNGKYQTKVGRDLLFIERNLDFLKPGGRMAVVLPQSRFNNSTDKRVRDYIAEHCRILAVVGLHGNVFKPHTGTKTSVLFVQKWDDELCPKVNDYPIFFATMQEPSKDNSGEKIYLKRKDLQALHGAETGDSDGDPPGGQSPRVHDDPTAHYEATGTSYDEFVLDEHGHLIVKHDLFNHDGLTRDGVAEAFREFAKREGLSFRAGKAVSPFDDAHYRALLEGLEITEANLSELERTHRIDPEFFQTCHLEVEKTLTAIETDSVADIVAVSDGNHFSIANEFVDEGVPYYRGQDVTGPFFAEQTSPIRITERAFHEKHMERSHLQKGDVLLSIVGTVGALSLVDSERRATCSCKLAIFRPHSIEPEFLAVFLESRLGSSQIQRFRRGAVQTGFLLEDADQVLVPRLTPKFRQVIGARVRTARQALEESNQKLKKAETRLLEFLKLENWQPPNPLSYEKSVSDVFEAERLDSQFFQVKYQAVEDRLTTQFELQALETLCMVTKGRTVPYAEDGDVKIIRSGDLIDISDAENFLTASSSEEIFYLHRGDVLISSIGFGSIGKVQVFDLDVPCGTVSEVTVLRPNSINPYFLCAFLRCIAGQLQIERWITGATGQLHLYARDVKKVLAPLVPEKQQAEFESLYRESQSKRQHSKALLERAKRAVEIAIEQDEETALAYLDGKHYVADELLPKLFGLARHYVDLETIQRTLEAEAIHYEDSTIHRYLHEWHREGRLHDAGRGWYSDLPEPFVPDPGIEIIHSVQSVLKDEFPLLDHTIWSTRELSAFFHHLPTRHATYLMIDRDAFDPVADALRDAGLHVTVHPLGEIAKKFSLEHDDTVILRPRLSSDHTETRSPVEHTLVDLHHEIQKLGLFEGEEYRHIVRNLATTCRLNITGLKRYAERRKIDPRVILGKFL